MNLVSMRTVVKGVLLQRALQAAIIRFTVMTLMLPIIKGVPSWILFENPLLPYALSASPPLLFCMLSGLITTILWKGLYLIRLEELLLYNH